LLLAIIAGLVVYIFRERLFRWWCDKTGQFTVFRVVFPDGRYADFVAYDPSGVRRLHTELQRSERTGEHFTMGGPVVSYSVIDGKDHDGQWMGPANSN
jgi:hypothetical protein